MKNIDLHIAKLWSAHKPYGKISLSRHLFRVSRGPRTPKHQLLTFQQCILPSYEVSKLDCLLASISLQQLKTREYIKKEHVYMYI